MKKRTVVMRIVEINRKMKLLVNQKQIKKIIIKSKRRNHPIKRMNLF